jgi:glycogen synthase
VTADPAALRVLWITETYPPSRGGMAQSCDRIVRGLRRAGATIDVLHVTPTARPGTEPFRVVPRAGGRYLPCPVDDDPPHAFNRAWSALQSQGDPDGITHVVAFGGSRPITVAPVLAAWLGVPLVTLIRGNDFDSAVFSARRRGPLDDALSRSALVAAVAQDKVRRIAALHPGVPVRWIPNGIDLDDWGTAPSDRARAAAWRAAEVPDGRRVIGMFGHLKPKKGGTLLLDALLRSGRADDAHLLLAGDRDEAMDAWLADHAGDVSWSGLPFLDRFELLPWYAACDWVAIPSFYDGLPNVLVEAAALGVPVLGSRVAGMADVLTDGETGLLFEPGDVDGCARALTRALTDDPEPFGRACRALAERAFDARTETARYVDALSACARVPAT